jgi:Transcription factor WhiB
MVGPIQLKLRYQGINAASISIMLPPVLGGLIQRSYAELPGTDGVGHGGLVDHRGALRGHQSTVHASQPQHPRGLDHLDRMPRPAMGQANPTDLPEIHKVPPGAASRCPLPRWCYHLSAGVRRTGARHGLWGPDRPPPPPFQYPPDWFPERGATGWPGSPSDVACAICRRCLVRFECLDYAIRNEITEGVWGGLFGRELRKAQGPRNEDAPHPCGLGCDLPALPFGAPKGPGRLFWAGRRMRCGGLPYVEHYRTLSAPGSISTARRAPTPSRRTPARLAASAPPDAPNIRSRGPEGPQEP